MTVAKSGALHKWLKCKAFHIYLLQIGQTWTGHHKPNQFSDLTIPFTHSEAYILLIKHEISTGH